MIIPKKTLTNGFSIPIFGIGTWRMGGVTERDPDNDDATEITAIRTAVEKGITHIDTAELYAAGHAEEMVAKAIHGYDRSKLFLVSKVLAKHLSKKDLRNSLEGSLQRLKTEYLDIYMIHFPSDTVPIEETMETMNKLADEGKIRFLAVSNFTLERMKKAQSVSKRPIVATQVHYNLLYREPEKSGLLPYCQDNNIILIAWRPVEKGILTGKSSPNNQSSSWLVQDRDEVTSRERDSGRVRSSLARMTTLAEVCNKYKKTPAQIAINWLISQKNVVTLSKMKSLDHIEENLGAVGWEMEKEDIELLRKEFPGQQNRSNAVPLH